MMEGGSILGIIKSFKESKLVAENKHVYLSGEGLTG